jgi:GNAT superfamily N-acetyltransferase
MSTVPLGWQTDLAVLRHSGSRIEDRGDHLLVTTPDNPGYHWGNFVFVSDASAVDDAARWLQTFENAFPEAAWVAIGLVRMPEDRSAWRAHRLGLELDEVLSARELPTQTPLADGYTVRTIAGDDWEQSVARAVADNERSGEHEATSFARFARQRAQAKRRLHERGTAAFFGAFHADVLVAELGIVRCDTTARYQSVGTDPEHRRRGLASHLLGVAARWAGERGCERWVIITESTNPAGRVYRSVGFQLDTGNAQAYRAVGR